MTTELTLPKRATVALGAAEHEKQLLLLAAEAKTITEIKNADARTQCHTAYMTLKNARVAISKTGKAAREDAKAFCDAVIAEERRLISITEAEENRLQALRDKWDADIEAERQAKIRAEQQRVATIREAISNIVSAPVRHVASDVTQLEQAIEFYTVIPITEQNYGEFMAEAEAARVDTLEKLGALRTAAKEKEAEAARLKAEREELARLRAEAEARRAEQERIAAEERVKQEAELRAAREKQEAELAAERAELEQRQADIARQQAALEAAQRLREEEAAEQEATATRTQAMMESHQQRRDAETQAAEEKFVTILDNDPEFASAAPAAPAVAAIRPIADTGARLRLGEINARIAPVAITAEGLAQLGYPHVETDKSAKLYRLCDFPSICSAIAHHVEAVAQEPAKAA